MLPSPPDSEIYQYEKNKQAWAHVNVVVIFTVTSERFQTNHTYILHRVANLE